MPEQGLDQLPDKLYFKIGEVSAIAGVPPYVLRFWESEFPRIRPRRTPSGQRMYRRADVERILYIKHLLYEKKFTIRGARKMMRDKAEGGAGDQAAPARGVSAPDHELSAPARGVLAQIRRELLDIRKLLSD